jgi:hypothetical protein
VPFSPVEVVGGIALGEGVGGAVAAVVEPQLQSLKNSQWADHPNIPPDAMALAEGVAHGHLAMEAAAAVAELSGFGAVQFATLVRIARSGPGTAYAFELWRRGKIGETAFRRALRRAALEDEWIDALVTVKEDVLDPAVIAVAVQRGLLPNDGILPVGPPTGAGKVPPMPRVDLDPFEEAAGSGVGADRLKVLARIVGLPASPDLAARMVFRKIIERVDFDRAISEGNTRNEWADALFEGFREILTAHNYAELELRGYLDRSERLAGTRKHGMSDADSDLLYDVLGRSIPVHQILTGEARGGVYNGPIDGIPEPFLASLRRGNLRREYFNLAYANRYTYPSGFMIRGLAQDGELTRAETHAILLEVGWSPKWATTFSERWTGGTAAAADPNVKKAQTQLWTRLHRSYIAGETDTNEAKDVLAQLGVEAGAQDEILALWLVERSLAVKQLTAAQVKKAWRNAVTNPATGAPWTREDATTRLIQMGYTYNDAATFLDE